MREAGRGALTTSAVYHPAADGLYKLDIKTGKLLARKPWRDSGDAGNVFIFGKHLVTTSKNGISIFEGFEQ